MEVENTPGTFCCSGGGGGDDDDDDEESAVSRIRQEFDTGLRGGGAC